MAKRSAIQSIMRRDDDPNQKRWQTVGPRCGKCGDTLQNGACPGCKIIETDMDCCAVAEVPADDDVEREIRAMEKEEELWLKKHES